MGRSRKTIRFFKQPLPAETSEFLKLMKKVGVDVLTA